MESYTLPTRLRLKQRAQLIAASLGTVPEHHPLHEVIARARARSTHLGHRCYSALAKTLRTMDLRRLQTLETIDPTPLAPWREQTFAEIEIKPNREKAKANAAARRDMPGTTVFSDASGQQNHLGAAASLPHPILSRTRSGSLHTTDPPAARTAGADRDRPLQHLTSGPPSLRGNSPSESTEYTHWDWPAFPPSRDHANDGPQPPAGPGNHRSQTASAMADSVVHRNRH